MLLYSNCVGDFCLNYDHTFGVIQYSCQGPLPVIWSVSKQGNVPVPFEPSFREHSVFLKGIFSVSNGNSSSSRMGMHGLIFPARAFSFITCSQLNAPFGSTECSQWKTALFSVPFRWEQTVFQIQRSGMRRSLKHTRTLCNSRWIYLYQNIPHIAS